jgi:hypothetical protein
MKEVRAPFARGGAVGGRAADEVEFAVEVFDEARSAEGGDGFSLGSVRADEVFEFHGRTVAQGGRTKTV